MSSGHTHDKITLLLTPIIAFGAWWFFGVYGIIAAIAFLFSGLMFNGDLDLKSQVYNRWLFLKWIWLPYQQFGHRSIWTHGVILGTLIRVLWVVVPTCIIMYFCGTAQLILPFVLQYQIPFLYALIGLELGNISHTFMDWMSTGFKKLF